MELEMDCESKLGSDWFDWLVRTLAMLAVVRLALPRLALFAIEP